MIVDISNVKTVTLAEVAEITGWDVKQFQDEITKDGVYRLLSGSRGYFDEVAFVQDLSDNTLELKSKQECVESLVFDIKDEEEIASTAEYVDEFYWVDVEEDKVMFGFTEEEFDFYFKIKI